MLSGLGVIIRIMVCIFKGGVLLVEHTNSVVVFMPTMNVMNTVHPLLSVFIRFITLIIVQIQGRLPHLRFFYFKSILVTAL
jgi:hypothetical protein